MPPMVHNSLGLLERLSLKQWFVSLENTFDFSIRMMEYPGPLEENCRNDCSTSFTSSEVDSYENTAC